MRPLHESMMR